MVLLNLLFTWKWFQHIGTDRIYNVKTLTMDNDCKTMIILGYVLAYRKHNTKKIINVKNRHILPQFHDLPIHYYLYNNTNEKGSNGSILIKLLVTSAIVSNLINIDGVDNNTGCVCKAQKDTSGIIMLLHMR